MTTKQEQQIVRPTKTNRHSAAHGLLFVFCLLLSCVVLASIPDDHPRRPTNDSRIHLIHSDVMYKNWNDPGAEVLVGNVKLNHEGVFLDCDSARFYREENRFDAYGRVVMIQGDTVKLTCDTLYYDGRDYMARAYGRVKLYHRDTRLETDNLNYDRLQGVGYYPQGGVLYDGDNVLVSDCGQYTMGTHEAFFTYNVQLNNPKFVLVSDTLYYYTDTEFARIVSPTNITSSDSTFVYAERGDYDTKKGKANLLNRSYIIKDMRKIVGDSLYSDKESGVDEAFGNVIITDEENLCILQGNYCKYYEQTGNAMATDSAMVIDYSTADSIFVHGDTLKMFTYNFNTDSVYRNLHAYNRVRMFRRDVQGVCDSLVIIQPDSCTYMYGQPILWNMNQQVFGEEIRVYNNDSTIDWVHVINQAMTIEQLDSVRYNQVSSKEMFSYFKDGEIDWNEAHGNVYVIYYVDEDDGNPIGLNYVETTDMKMWMENRKIQKIWMPTAKCNMYPPLKIPADRLHLENFAWFDYIRPLDKDDIFVWRGKESKYILKKTEQKSAPIQNLNALK